MGYTIMQQSATAPTIEQLKRAFGGVPGFTAFDAGNFCKETFGIIARNFTEPQATAVQAGLKTEGIDTAIIDDKQLPPIPVIKVIRKLECTPEALMIFDPYGRKFPVAWGHVALLAAGNVKQATFERKRTEHEEVRIRMRGFVPVQERTVKVEYTSKENTAKLLRAEIVLSGGVAQYSIEAEGFNFETLGERVTQDKEVNFCGLMRQLVKYAPQAGLNRGATAVLAEPPQFTVYPGKNSLQDEIQWLLWLQRGEAK